MLAVALLSLVFAGNLVCDGEHESPECAAELMASAERNLALPPIRGEFSAGAEVYRAVFDGGNYGRPAISFERRPGRSPELVVYGTGGQTVRRGIGADLWRTVRDRSRYVGRRLERSDAYSMTCLVSSDVVVQVSRPVVSRPDQSPERALLLATLVRSGVVQASQNSCEGGLTWDYGIFLAEAACDEIPQCAVMGPHDQFTQAVENLGAIFRLRGDTVAAASLSAAKQWAPSRTRHDQPLAAEAFAEWLSPESEAILHWGASAPVREGFPGGAISTVLAEQDRSTGGLRFDPQEFGADSVDVGWVAGTVSHSVRTDGTWRTSEAPYRQTWLRSGENWRLWSMTVGEFADRTAEPGGSD